MQAPLFRIMPAAALALFRALWLGYAPIVLLRRQHFSPVARPFAAARHPVEQAHRDVR